MRMASSSRSRDRNEVNSARNKLDGVLQTLMDKADDSTEASDDESRFAAELVLKEMAASASPSKRTGGSKVPRKRRRKDDTGGLETNNGHFSYVMKLFDRSVDLAQFKEDTPLYPICRSWMSNEPYTGNFRPKEPESKSSLDDATQSNNEEEEEGGLKPVYSLPKPLKMPKQERNQNQGIRIPVPVFTTDKLNTDDLNSDHPKDELLENHMKRWKAIRQSWKDAAALNESRYKESLSIIKSLKTVYE